MLDTAIDNILTANCNYSQNSKTKTITYSIILQKSFGDTTG